MLSTITIALLLRLTTPTPHLYTASEFADHLPFTTADFVSNLPFTSTDLESNLPYTAREWESDLDRKLTCQCLTLKVSPDGSVVMGSARPCSCDE